MTDCGWRRPELSGRDRLRRAGLVAQQEFLDLARGRLRDRSEHDGLWRLEARHLVAAEGDDVGLAWPRAVLEFDEGAGHLAPFRIGLCDHGGKQHGRVLVEDVLDLDRRY